MLDYLRIGVQHVSTLGHFSLGFETLLDRVGVVGAVLVALFTS